MMNPRGFLFRGIVFRSLPCALTSSPDKGRNEEGFAAVEKPKAVKPTQLLPCQGRERTMRPY
jgi:hypothetical protein